MPQWQDHSECPGGSRERPDTYLRFSVTWGEPSETLAIHTGGAAPAASQRSRVPSPPLRSRGADTRNCVLHIRAPTRPLPALTARSGSRSRRWGRRWPVPARIGRAGSWAGPARAAPTPQLGGCCRCCCCCSAWRPRRPPWWGAGKWWPYFGEKGQQPPRSGKAPAALGIPAAVPPGAATAPAAAWPPASRPARPRSAAQPLRPLRGRRKRKLLRSPPCRSISFVNAPVFLWVVSGIWREWGAT